MMFLVVDCGAIRLKATFRFNAGAGKFGAAYAQVFTFEIYVCHSYLNIFNVFSFH